MNPLIVSKAGNPDDISLGRALIASGKVGCIVLAGGDGSRLGWQGPKGTFPVSLVKQKSLFQLLLERVDAASKAFGKQLPVAVMTSPLNHEQTRKALPSHFELFDQEVVPLLDLEGNPLDDSRPNGNGDVLKLFYASGIYDKWRALGIEYIQIVLIDNPLAEPFDPNQIGIQYKTGADITLKAVEKKSPNEKMGAIGSVDGKIQIVEYSENPPKDWKLGSTSLFGFTMDFALKVKDQTLPAHRVKRVIDGKTVYKTECFIFDLLAFAEKVEVILYDRDKTFAPLKERSDVGPVQRALLERDRRAFERLTGSPPADHIFELDATLHFPTDAIALKWKGKTHPGSSYITP